MVTESQVLDALSHVMDPELGKNLVELNMVKNIQVTADGVVSVTMEVL